MGLKKLAKKVSGAVSQVVSAPIKIAATSTDKALNVSGVGNVLSGFGIDSKNLTNVVRDVSDMKYEGNSTQFKNALFDASKIGMAGAGLGGTLTATQAGAGFLLASKAQAGGGVSLADAASLGGFDTTFGGIDWGGVNIVKPKTPDPVSGSKPASGSYFNDTLPNYSLSSGSSESQFVIIIGIGIVLLIVFILITKR